MAHYDIFRRNLAIKYPAYGHALWEPSPGDRYPAVAVGDVGFIRDGRFHRLFNILLNPKDPSHRIFGVPEEDEQLRPRVEDHVITGTLTPNLFCSPGVALESESRVQANEPRSSTALSFSCRRKQGAVMSLPIQARCEDTVALGDFRKWMINHIDLWFTWARELGMGIKRMEDILLVTGAHLARSWTNVAFLEDQIDARVSVEFQVDADTTIDWNLLPDRTIGALLNCGPTGKDLPEDQCIFIRGYRVTRKFMILPRTLKGAAGPNPDSKDSDSDPEMELVSISTVPEVRCSLTLFHFLILVSTVKVPGLSSYTIRIHRRSDHYGHFLHVLDTDMNRTECTRLRHGPRS
ncbi:hypothetical protein EI94DRAFT_1745599 [Lactarius quietus]|nr:hypothetical protein EI94DRAFT_1745599 [Lactarius quietus]